MPAATSLTGRRSRRLLSARLLVTSLVVAASAPWSVGCSGGDPSSGHDSGASAVSDAPGAPPPTTPTTPATTSPATTAPDESTGATEPTAIEPASMVTEPTDAASSIDSAEPAPVSDPLDDLDEDGTRDERCGTVDLGGGLVVETLCNTELVPAPENGVVATAGSLLLLPSPTRWDDLADVDATIRTATTPDGHRVVIYVLGSDTLFDTGSADVRATATPPLAAIAASITTRFPDAPIAVRGAADSVGEPAANQVLSERRATAVAGALATLGIDPARLTAEGLGEDHPVAEEQLPDGSVSDIGRQVNRRVEIVVG